MTKLTRHPNEVLTARLARPKLEHSLVKLEISWTRGRSSATITKLRKLAKLTSRD